MVIRHQIAAFCMPLHQILSQSFCPRMTVISANERIIRETFPGRAAISAEDLGQLLRGSRSRGVANGIRRKLREDNLIPGLRKSAGGGWLIPISAAARVLDDLQQEELPPDWRPAAKRRARAPQGPRRMISMARTSEFLTRLLAVVVENDLADRRDAEHKSLTDALADVLAAKGREPCSRCGRQHSGKCRMF